MLHSYPDNVVREFVRESKAYGVDIFRVFDSLNDLDNLRFGLDAVAATGGIVEGTLCYTGDVSDPRKTKVGGFCACAIPPPDIPGQPRHACSRHAVACCQQRGMLRDTGSQGYCRAVLRGRGTAGNH